MSDDDQPTGASPVHLPGEGNVRARTIRIGHVILALDNIDSIALTVRPRNTGVIIFTSVMIGAVSAGAVHSVNPDYLLSGSMFLIVLGAGVAAALRWPAKSVLAIATSGGRVYYVGGDKEFLIHLGELLRAKIDSGDESLTATFSAKERTVSAPPPPRLLETPPRSPSPPHKVSG